MGKSDLNLYTLRPDFQLRVQVLAVIRVVFVFFYFLLINFLLILICLIRPFHRDNVYAAAMLYSSLARFLGVKLVVRVPESVRTGGPYVFICNHQNSYDLLTVCRAAQRGMVTVGKKSLKWIPVFGWVYWLSGNIMIDRKNKGKAHDTLKVTADKIKERRLSVWFFPEGTRSNGRGLQAFKTGAFRIAQATNEPIVTVSVSELHDKIKLNRWDNGTLLIDVAEPVDVDPDASAKELASFFRDKMQSKINELNQEVAESEKAG